jgi:hypothetical protein
MTPDGGTATSHPGAIRLDIRQVTLDGYSPGQRDHFARALHEQLARRGAPESAARHAAEAILAAVDDRLAGGGRANA